MKKLFFTIFCLTGLSVVSLGSDVTYESDLVSTQIEVDINASITNVFDFVVAEDVLPKVLHKSGVIPGVVGTTILKNPSWNAPGALRIVHLSDGNTALEEVTGFDRPTHFSYQSSNYTGLFSHVVDQAKGEWWFEERDGKTHVTWKYSFKAKNILGHTFLACWLAPHSFHRYMKKAMDRIRRFVENGHD